MRFRDLTRRFIPCAALALAFAWVAGVQPAVVRGQPPGLVLAVPNRASAHVSLAAEGSFVAAVWSASRPSGTTDIYSSVSRNGGATFQAPVRVNAVAGDAHVNGEQPPRVALAPRATGLPEIAVIWTTKGAKGTKLLTARSIDGGRTYSKSATVPDTDVAGNRGWETITDAPGGRFVAAWLDHRRLAQRQTTKMEGEHHHGGPAAKPASPAADGVAMAQLSQLYVAPIDGAFPPVAVTGGVCYCCKTAIAANRSNAIFVAWRHVYPGNMRDIAFAASRDGGRTFSPPVRISEDKWQIDGCPDDGPAMAIDDADRIHVVWPTVVVENGGPVKALFHSVSRDARSFSPRVRLPAQGHANHPQIAMFPDGAVMVAWDESGSGSRKLAFARGGVDGAGRVTFTRRPSPADVGTYPVLVTTSRGALAAWTSAAADRSVIRIDEVR